MTTLRQDYQAALDQLLFDPDPIAYEFRYRCNDPVEGFRILFTKDEEMSLFDIPVGAFERPVVYNLNDFWPERSLHNFIRFLFETARDAEQELQQNKPLEEYLPEIEAEFHEARKQLMENSYEESALPVNILFTTLATLITLAMYAEGKSNKNTGIFILPRHSPALH